MNRTMKRMLLLASLGLPGLAVGVACATSTSGQEAPAPRQPLEVVAQEPDRHPDVDFDVSCVECHQRVTPRSVQSWEESVHGQVGVGCFVCHGDGEEEFHIQPPVQVCETCHAGQDVDFTASPAETCDDCHSGHDLKFHER